MEKSIEMIWKEGFLKNEDIVIPKIKDLYNQKSKNIIDKIIRMMKINIIALIVIAISLLIYTLIIGIPVLLGVFLLFLFIIPAIYSAIQMNNLPNIDKSENSYVYLKSFNNWLKEQITRYMMLSRFFYPICVLSASLILWFSEGREEIMGKLYNQFPDMVFIYGIPLYFILAVLLACLLIFVFSEKVYKWDINIVYGRVFRKLEEIISDMEELRD